MTDLVRSVQRLLDLEEIRDVVFRYARAIDRLDVQLLRSAFWDDGGFEDGVFEGPASEFAPTLIATVGNTFTATQHFISNVRVEFSGQDVAFAESYFYAVHLLKRDELVAKAILGSDRIDAIGGDPSRAFELSVGGRYFDRFERREDAWRIGKRRFVSDWTACGPNSGVGRDGFGTLWKLTGSRDGDDPSYHQ